MSFDAVNPSRVHTMQRFRYPRAIQQVLLTLSILIAYGNMAAAQDVETVKANVLKSLAKIEGYSVGVVKGTWINSAVIERSGQFHFRDHQMWIEYDGSDLREDPEKRAARIKAAREARGTVGLLHTSEFDGTTHYDFDPYNLALQISPTTKLPPIFAGLPLLPQNWLSMGGAPTQRFDRFIGDPDYEVNVEPLGDGRWKLSQSDLGSRLPEEVRKQFIGVKDRWIIVDEKCDFLVTEYYGIGEKVQVEGFMEWEKQEGRWYAKHGKQLFGGRPFLEWFIESISFDPSKCRTEFSDLESTVPPATRIDTYDEKKRLVSRAYKNGKEGEAEYQRRTGNSLPPFSRAEAQR
ncbi:MAG: hypothetical protein ACTHK7_07985 [Aureliella sp.]